VLATPYLLAHLVRRRLAERLTDDLDGEIEPTVRAYVGAAVTGIATVRAEPSGPQIG
jgi:hypothetical protein